MQTGDKSMMTINPFFPFTLYLTNVSHMDFLKIFCSVRNHVKLEICSFVMNFNSGGFSLRVLYCVVNTGYGLGRSMGECRPVLPKG